MIIKFLIKKLNKVKICAVFTTVCFIVSTLGANLYALPTAENINKKYEDVFNEVSCISSVYGKITSSKDAKSNITVINIQDLHCHPQTQRNISKIIGEIADKYNLTKIFVEGGYGDIDTSWLNQIKDENIRKQVIEKLLNEGILTGSEYYKLTGNNNKVELKGIDEEKLHKDNVRRLAWIISQQDKYKDIIEKITNEIKILAKTYVNVRNERFNRNIEDYFANRLDSKKFYKQLIKYVKDINSHPDKYNNITAIRLEDYPNITKFMLLKQTSSHINVKEVTQQLQTVLTELKNRLPYNVYTKMLNETDNLSNSQKVVELISSLCNKEGIDLERYEDLKLFLETNYNTKKINPIDLVLEERQLITEIRKALSYNNEEYEITFISDFSKFFEDYLEYKLTDTDWKYFETFYTRFRTLYAKYATVDRIKEIEEDFEEINKYYNINDHRNNIFVENLLKNEKPEPIKSSHLRQDEEILKNSKEVIIAVTGGFHSGELEQILASNDVNAVVITPKIYEDIKQANEKYIELIGIQSRVRSQALSYTIASSVTDIDKQKILLAVVKDILGSDVEKIKEILGKNVDLSLLYEEPVIDSKQKNEIRKIIENTVNQVIDIIPQQGMKGVLAPDIDNIMLNTAKLLVKNGIYFSKGAIFDIEKKGINGKDLKGIPAEIYSRMMPALQKALLNVTEEPATLNELNQDIQDLYDDTGATESTYIYLEDIDNNPQLFIELLRDSITNKKLIVLKMFRNAEDIDKLDREEQNKLYRKIRELFFKIYTDKPLYTDDFISKPENQDYINYDIHFFLLEILENSFMHGNRGLDKPIFIYMDKDENNEIKTLKIYNRISDEDDNFQMRFIRMRLALLGGQHKSNVLMEQNPYRTFEVDDSFKGNFYKVSSDIKPSYDEEAATWLKKNNDSINYFSIAAPFKDKNKFFHFLHETAHIWEELLFRTLPISLPILPITAFLPVPAVLAIFTISQILFIKSHGGSFKEQLTQKFLPTTILTAPYLLALLFAPGIPAIICSTIIGIGLHKFFNFVLKSKMNIFSEETKEELFTVSDFLANKQFIDLSDVQEQQRLAKLLDGELSDQDVANIVNKIDLNFISQSINLLESFYKQRVIGNTNKRRIVYALAKKADVNNSNQLIFLGNILLSDKYSLSVDEDVAFTLVEKLDFNNKKHVNFLIDYFKLKNYDRNFQNPRLNNNVINKIDINDYNQIQLLGLFSFIDDDTLRSLLFEFDFTNKDSLRKLFKTISNQNLTQKRESFELILDRLDLEDNTDFEILQNIISQNNSIDGTAIDKIFNVLNFKKEKHLSLIENIINKGKTGITIIESFTKHMDVEDEAHKELIEKIIKSFFLNSTADTKLAFFERITEILTKIKSADIRLSKEEEYVLELFTKELISNMHKVLSSIQNENIKTKDDKITVFLGFYNKLFEELNRLAKLLSSSEINEQISYIKDMIGEKITIKDFAEKFGFRFSQQTPNTYIDSDRYSFTKLLSLFPEKILKHTVKKHSPTYVIEKEEFDEGALDTLLVKFNAYMKLLDENMLAINKLGEITNFDSQFDTVVNHIKTMINCLSVFNSGDAEFFQRILNELLEKINNGQTTVKEQKSLSRNPNRIETISSLINKIHQSANLDFVLNIREMSRETLRTAQNVFVSKDDRTIGVYNLSQKPISPEIKRLLLMLIENPDFTTTDRNSQVFIKDNIFLWNGLLGDHSARVLIDFNKDSENIFIDFSEGERSNESRSRISALKEILSNFGFNVKLYNNNNSLIATINKDTGLTNSTDICDMAQKAMIALSNAASLYRTNIPKQVIDTASLGVMDIYKKCFFVSAIENNIIKTKVNNVSFLNRILAYLHLPKIPFNESGMISYIKVGPFFKRQVKTLGQNTINKYINWPIEQAFATGYLKINEDGVLETNKEYNPILSIATKLNTFLDKDIGDGQETEMLNQGAILSQIPEQDLNLKTCGQLGRYIMKTGYIKLSNGVLNSDTKGEFLNVRILVDENGIIRYSETDLVGLPEFMKTKTGRIELTSDQLQQVLSKQGYDDISTPEKLTDTEVLNYRVKLQEDISSSKMPVTYGILMSTPKEGETVVGIMGKTDNIFIDKFASPENVDIAAQNKISLFVGGSYSSHAAIVLREYHKTAMVVNDSQIIREDSKDSKVGMRIKFYQSKDTTVKIGAIDTQEIEETEITLQDKDIVIVDLTSNRLILYPNSIFKDILFDLQQYIDNKDAARVREFIEKNRNNELIEKIIEYIYYQAGDNEWLQEILSEYTEYNVVNPATSQQPLRFIKRKKLTIKKFLPHTASGKAYRFGERESLDRTKVGTKAANQAKLHLNIDQLRQDTGVKNVASPDGVAINHSILEDILGVEYTRRYKELESLINKKEKSNSDYDRIQTILSEITNLINNISNTKIRNYVGKQNLQLFKNKKVIVRSSGVGEDSQEYSAAGIAESYGNVEDKKIEDAIRMSLCSFFSDKAINYMLKTGNMIKPAVLIEEWIDADQAGIMMSENSEGNRLIQVINGKGEDIVSGRISPYSFVIDINTREKIDGNYTSKKTLTSEQLEDLTKIMEWLEEVEGVPVDVEFVIKSGIIYIVQVRPITTLGYTAPEDAGYEIVTDKTKEKKSSASSEKADTKSDKRTKETTKKVKNKHKFTSSVTRERTEHTSIFHIISQPEGMTLRDILRSFTKLAKSKDSSDKSLELNKEQIKKYLLRLGLERHTVENINFDEGLPEYVVKLLKSRNSQVQGTTIDPRKSLIENLKEHPILFSLAIETLTRVYAKNLGNNATLGDLLDFIGQRSAKKLYEATCTDLRGYFGEFYAANTLIAGIIPDKRAGPIIIRPELPSDSNIRGYDIYNPIDGVKTQVKTGGSDIVHHHFRRYWKPSVRGLINRIMAIPVLTTKNVKNNSFPNDERVQGMDVTTETVTKFSHEFISALQGIRYKRNIPAVRNIPLKDLIDSFKGVPDENSLTLDELIDLLTNKNQIVGNKKQQKKGEKSKVSQDKGIVIDFNQQFGDVSKLFGENLVVGIKTEETDENEEPHVLYHVLYIDKQKISLNEEGREVLEEEDFPLYGIDKVEYDEHGNIKNIFFNQGTQLSTLKVDGIPTGSPENNISFSTPKLKQELEALYSETGTSEYVDIYLDGDVDEICHLIKHAARENKLIIFHLFKEGFKTSDLTPSQILDLYKKVSTLISNRFLLSDIFPHDFDDKKYTDYGLDFFIEEILKNSFIHANNGNLENPIVMHIKLDKKENIQSFSIYNRKINGEISEDRRVLAISSHLIRTGDSKSTDIMRNNPVREYSLIEEYDIASKKFQKTEVRLRDSVNTELYKLEQDYKNSEENVSITDIILQSGTTQKELYRRGVEKYTKRYLERTGKQEKDLTFEERLEIEEQAKEYRFTASGLFEGVKIELFTFFSRDFIKSHSNMPLVSKIAVHTIRVLSIGIGLSSIICSFSIFPVGVAIVSILLSPFTTLFSSAVLHFLWNVIAIITNNPDWLLQADKIIIPEEEKVEEKGRSLTEEEKENLERARKDQEDYYDSIYTYQPNEALQKDVKEVFDNLINAMVALGWITEEEKNQYQLHYYYQPTTNAFTINNSKDVYLFSQLLFELDKSLRKEGKALTKDMIAAILAHELRHTIQEIRKYEYLDASKSKVVNRSSDKRREYDADTGALEILDMAGYNPKAMQEVLAFFCKISGDSKLNSVFVLLDAHPHSEDRLKAISSLLESKDISFMNIDKQEQPLTSTSIKPYFKFTASVTRKIIAIGYRIQIVRKIIFAFLLSDKSTFFSKEEKDFLLNASDKQKRYIYELLFPQGKESKLSIRQLSEQEKGELFDFVIDNLNVYKARNFNSLFFDELIPNMNMTSEKWEKFNKFRTLVGSITMEYISDEGLWFYANNYQNLTKNELQSLTRTLMLRNDNFLQNTTINKRQFIQLLFTLLKESKTFFSANINNLLKEVDSAKYFTDEEKKEFFYLLSQSSKNEKIILKILELTKQQNVTDSLVSLFKLFASVETEYKPDKIWYDYIIEKYSQDLSECDPKEMETIALSLQQNYSKDFSPFILGWFIKSINPKAKIYFVTNFHESKNPKFADGVCLWPGMFRDGINYEGILKGMNINNGLLIERLRAFQEKIKEIGTTNEDISFLTNKLLLQAGMWDKYKYDFKYLLCFLENKEKIQIETDSSSSYPIEYLKDIVEIQLPQASYFDLGSKFRFTKYFIHLAELHGLSLDYQNESLENIIEQIKKQFNISTIFFKRDNNGKFTSKEQESIHDIEENLKNMEITRAFIYKAHKLFNIEPTSKTIKFKSGNDNYNYDYFEINPTLLEQIPTDAQAQELINLFALIKKELPKENTELYAKIIYKILKRNPNLSVFSSAEENIKLIDFLFDDFSKAKDDYINELMDNYVITPSQYIELRKKTSLVQYEQQSESSNTKVAKEEILYFMIQHITDQNDRINFLLWLMSSEKDSKFYRTYILGNIKCKDNDDVKINFDSLKTEFLLMSKTERENVIRTIFLGSNGILTTSDKQNNDINKVINGLQNILFNNLFFSEEKTDSLNVAMASMFKKIFEIVFKNVSDERKVIFVNNLFSALIDIKNETENSDMEEGELRARQLGRLIVAIGVNSGMAVLKLLQILSNNKVFEQLDPKYGTIINEEVAKVRSENEPLSKFVIFKYLERLGLLDKVEFVGKCLGSASIGLTYLVKFIGKDQIDVVKIKRPNILKNYDEDFKIFEKIREYVISESSPLPQQYKKMIPRARHLKNIFDDELNFELESENLEIFSKQLRERNSNIRVPQLINRGAFLFTQTNARGKSLNKLSVSTTERKDIYFEILKEFFTEVFVDAQNSPNGEALYHADLHAGNIFVDEEGNITFIDLGGVGKVNKTTSKSLKKIFIFLCIGNYSGFMASLKEYNRHIKLSAENKNKIKEILERKSSLESKFADLFEIFNNLEDMDKDFLMFMQSISKIAAYIDELELIDSDGKVNLDDILKYGNKLLNKDLSSLGTIFKENPEIFKTLAVSVYTKNYENFINVLSTYAPEVVNNLSQEEKNNIKNILESRISLQSKIDSLMEIFSETAVVNETLLLIFETASKLISYIGEEELKDIITKLVVSQVKNKIFHFPSKKGRVSKEARTTTAIEQEKISVIELILEKCKDLSNSNRAQLEQKINGADNDTIRNCLKNSIIGLTAKQIISFIDIANYLYENGYINQQNEYDKINILFKAVTDFNFTQEQIKDLFEIEPLYIDEILKIIEQPEKKRKQRKILNNFLKEKNKLNLEEMDIEILKTLLNSSDKNNSVLSLLPTHIAKKLLSNKKKLQLMHFFLENGDDREIDLSLIVKLIDLPDEILETVSNNRWSSDPDYMYDLNKFCDLYEQCYDKDKFYNIHRFTLCLLGFTSVKNRDTSTRRYKLLISLKNLGVLITWKFPVLLKLSTFINKHKQLSSKDKQIIEIFKKAKDVKTLEDMAQQIYVSKIKTILKECQRMNIPIDSENIKFKSILNCIKNGISITPTVRTKIENIKDKESYDELVKYANNLLEQRKNIKGTFKFLDEHAHIWEEIVFRILPTIVSVINPALGFYVYASAQIIFILAHAIPKLLGRKTLSDASKETKELIFSVPMLLNYLLGAFVALNGPLAIYFASDFVGITKILIQAIIPAVVTIFSLFAMIIHRDYNDEHTSNPLSIVANILAAKKTSNEDKKKFAIYELLNILKPINLRKEIKRSEISQYFVTQAKNNGSRFISIYDLTKLLRSLNKKDFRNNKGIESYRGGTPDRTPRPAFLRSIDRTTPEEAFENECKIVENSFGFSLGLSYTNVSDTTNRKINLVQAISERNNLVSWERGYEYFYGKEYSARPPEEYMDDIRRMSMEYNKKIFFFLPSNIDSDDLSFKTRRELEYIQNHPEMQKNVVFVFGTYDCFNIENGEIFNKYFNNDTIYSTLKKLLSNPGIYIKKKLSLKEKIQSHGLYKLSNNVLKLSFSGIFNLVSTIKNLEFSKKQDISQNTGAVEQLRRDIINDAHKKVCFICTANINRSAVSHLLFEDKMLKLGIDNISVVSAGLMPISQRNKTNVLSLGQDYANILIDNNVDPDLIDAFRSESFSEKHSDSDYFVVASQKHKAVLIKKYNIDPEKIILYSDLYPELRGDALPDPQKRKISKTGIVALVNHIFNISLFNFILKGSITWLTKILLNKSSNIQTTVVSYRAAKATEIDKFLDTSQASQQQDLTEVYIVDDMKRLDNTYTVINTGIKVDGVSIYKIKAGNLLMYGTIENIPRIKVAKALNETEQLKKEIKDLLSLQGDIEIDGIIRRNGEGIGINGGLLEVGEMELYGKTSAEQTKFMLSALEVKRTLGITFGQKTIIDLKQLSGQELLTALENGRTRKVITESQFEQLNLTVDKLFELREQGIEIYVETENDKYRNTGISGKIITEGEKTYIYDYYSDDKIEIEVLSKERDLEFLEQKIINSEKPLIIDIEILKKGFQGKNSIEAFEILGALLGKIKITMGMRNINKKDIENLGYNIKFEKIPSMTLQDAKDFSQISNTETILGIIGKDSEFGIILRSIEEKEMAERFITIIKERVLAKSKMIESGNEIEGIELKDRQLEKMLGKLLLRAENNKYQALSDEEINNLMKDVTPINLIEELMKNVEELKILDEKNKGKDLSEQELLVNKIILFILYSERKNGKQIQKQAVVGDIAQYRAMLAAA